MKHCVPTIVIVVLLFGITMSSSVAGAITGDELKLPAVDELASLRRSQGHAHTVLHEISLDGHAKLVALDFDSATRPFLGKPATPENLAALRDAVTRVVIDAGFINSGARIPKQKIAEGTLSIDLVEGKLDRVRVVGARHFRSDYLEKRIRLDGDDPLNIGELERRLQWLAAEPLIKRVRAKLEPGLNPGEAVLVVNIREEDPYVLSLFVGNDTVRSIGSEHMRVTAGHRNVLGNRDSFEAYLGQTEGLDEWKVNYSIPLNRFDTRLFSSYRDSKSTVVRSNVDLDAIRLESRSRTFSIGIEQPVRFGKRTELKLGLRGDLRRAYSEVNGFGFFLSPGDDENGRVRASVLRVSQQISRRSRHSVFSLRSTVSLGLDVFKASKGEIGRGSNIPDGTFVTWLGQAYWVGRLPASLRKSQLIVRGDVQWSRDPLLGMERFSVGGQRTVRGYSENAVVRDSGFAASIELRVPLIKKPRKGWSIELAPFVDGGHAWNRGDLHDRDTLLSAGLGLRTRYRERLSISFEWGKRLLNQEASSNGLQGHGIHLQAEVGI